MTVAMLLKDAIVEHCDQQIALLGDIADIALILPGKWGKKDERRLCKGGPIGEIVHDNFDGRGIVVMFNATEVKQFLTK